MDYRRHFKYHPGELVEAHMGTPPNYNSPMRSKTTPAVVLLGTESSSCSYRCINLETGRLITPTKLIRKDWDEETMALANKLSDHRSEISDTIGLQEIYLSDQLSEDFAMTGDISFQEGSPTPVPQHAYAENDDVPAAMTVDEDPSPDKSNDDDDLGMVDIRATVMRVATTRSKVKKPRKIPSEFNIHKKKHPI